MKLWVMCDANAVSRRTLSVMCQTIKEKPGCVIGYPTGGTVKLLYEMLRKEVADGGIDMSQTRAFQLDDYLGLPPAHPRRFACVLNEQVFDPCGVAPENTCLFGHEFTEADGRAYDARIEEWGGIDLQLLGIGSNGHVGFNEPAPVFSQGTHIARLTEETRRGALSAFGSIDELPRHAVTMGIGTIMRARKLILLAMGRAKAEAIAAMLLKEPSPLCPASALMSHPDLIVLVDREAAALLPQSMVLGAQGGEN